MSKSQMISTALKEFIELIQSDSEIELYNEAGLQHEMALFLRKEIGDVFKIELERNVKVFCKEDEKYEKKEMDIYLFEKKNPNNKYCIELKLSLGRAVPRRMYLAFSDVLFLEQLKHKGFKKCFLFFTTPKNDFWKFKKAEHKLRSYFNGDKIDFYALFNADIPQFLKSVKDDCIFSIKGEYTTKWQDLKVQKKELWRYFLLEL